MDLSKILLFLLILWNCYSTIKTTIKVIISGVTLFNAKRNGSEIIRCTSVVYKVRYYIFTIAFELFIAGYCFKWFLMLKNLEIEGLVICLLITIIMMLINVIIHIIAIFREKYAYLTEEGIISFVRKFKFSKCRFSWESDDSADVVSDTLHVYPKKDNIPYTVVFESQAEQAHRIVSENCMKTY
mgnify:FL=1